MDTSQRYLEIAREFATELRRRAASSIRDVLVYGSVARGEATEASDIDVVVVYADDGSPADVPVEVAAEMMDKHNALVAVLDCSESEYRRLLRFPFGWRIAEEAVPL